MFCVFRNIIYTNYVQLLLQLLQLYFYHERETQEKECREYHFGNFLTKTIILRYIEKANSIFVYFFDKKKIDVLK